MKKILTPFLVPKIIKFIKTEKIEKMVCVHELLIHCARIAINRVDPSIKLITVLMDPFTAHPIWFFEKDTELIVFSKKLKEEAVKIYGFEPARIRQYPVMISEKFTEKYTVEKKHEVKSFFKITPDKKIVLIVGGGEGLKDAYAIVKSFISKNVDAYLIIVCGKNRQLKQRLDLLVSLSQNKNIKIFGFVSFMHVLMNIADCIVTKGGPATLFEALIINKPIIISNYVRGQELGNVLYITQNKAGWYLPKPKNIVSKVEEIFSNPTELKEIKENIKNLKIRNGIDDIAKFVYSFN